MDRVGEILRISPYSVQMRENVGKMRTRITPNTNTFYAVSVNQQSEMLYILFLLNAQVGVYQKILKVRC